MIWIRPARWGFSIAGILLAVTFSHASAAVTVSSFNAQAQSNQIVLNWKTASETNNAGFNLYRATSPNGPWTTKLNGGNIIPGCPGCPLGGNYSFNDVTAAKGQTYYYRLESVEFTGSTQPFGPVNAQISASATATSTNVAPTATRTTTSAGTATSASTSIPGTATPMIYNSPTPLDSPLPTRVAYAVGQPTLTPGLASNVKSAPPKSNAPNAAPGANASSSVSENSSPSVSDNSTATNSTSEPVTLDAPSPKSVSNAFTLAMIGVAGLLGFSALSIGAVSFYFFARRFTH